MFALDNEDHVRDLYLEMHSALHGQLCFASVAESHPQAAWFKINDPVAEFDRIRRLVGEAFWCVLVPTPIRARLAPTIPPSAIKHWPAVLSSSVPITPSPTAGSHRTACSSLTVSSRG